MIFARPQEEKNEIALHSFNGGQIFVRQLKNPLLIILILATSISLAFGQSTNAIVIFYMIALSVGLGFYNEYSAEKTVSDLLKKVSMFATVIVNGTKMDVPVRDLKIGDTVYLQTGSVVPADLKIISHQNMEVNEASLSGESLPVAKSETDLSLYMGTIVTNGIATGVVTAIGRYTRFGKIAVDLAVARPETDFQKGLRGFGNLLVKVIFVMALSIFGINFLLGHSIIDSALFSLAIAIGLTPELLPVIVTVSLAHGAKQLARKEVIVKQLTAIEDLGNMEVLATDKTGTLTEGKISLVSYLNQSNERDESVLQLALIANSAVVHHRIFGDAVDSSIWEYARENGFHPHPHVTKIFEEPFNFTHRSMFSVVEEKIKKLDSASYSYSYSYIVKGAPENVIAACSMDTRAKHKILKHFEDLSRDGYRVITLARKSISKKPEYSFADAVGMEFAGYLTFTDTPKKSARQAIDKLESMGIRVKILTGDNELVTRHVCSVVDIPCDQIILGSQLDQLSETQLREVVWQTDAFCRISPDQKLRIIQALQFGGHSVGFMGDGINDGPALHSADVALSVNTAVDVAKDTATIVLLHKSLSVIADGVLTGRKVFANTIKYILMGTSSNFGNMFSAAGASFFLPFLPMTPAQILLTNSLYDISQLSIPTDNVDPESLIKPKHWDVNFIRRYMLLFGPISSIYDFLTFGVMLFIFHAQSSLFQTGWFIESLMTEIMVVFVIRTARTPFYRSRPSTPIIATCLGVVGLGIMLPFSPLKTILGFTTPPPLYFVILVVMTLTYLLIVETGKKYLNRLSKSS